MLVDQLYRAAYRIAYRLMCIYWRLTRAKTHGALVAIWHQGQILLSKNSYVDYYCVPGGYLKLAETAQDAAVRELSEELQIRILAEDLRMGHEETHLFAGKTDHVIIFDIEVASKPAFRVDGREVISAGFFSPEEALKRELFPPLRRHIENTLTRLAAARSPSLTGCGQP